jgi:Raf kinase inhibitor-like YbhB/YbcL family protein
MRRSLASALAAAVLAAACGADPVPSAGTGAGPDPADRGGTMRLTSGAFEHDGTIPVRYTCDGEDLSPPLSVAAIPAGTESLVLVMDDPDAPGGVWDHWVVSDIPPPSGSGELAIAAGAAPAGTAGSNSWGRTGYGGPCPPSGTHRYVFRVYALDDRPGLPAGASKSEVLEAATGHVLAQAVLVGRYGR